MRRGPEADPGLSNDELQLLDDIAVVLSDVTRRIAGVSTTLLDLVAVHNQRARVDQRRPRTRALSNGGARLSAVEPNDA